MLVAEVMENIQEEVVVQDMVMVVTADKKQLYVLTQVPVLIVVLPVAKEAIP